MMKPLRVEKTALLVLALLAGCVRSQNIQPTSTETQTSVSAITSTPTSIPPDLTSTPQPRFIPATYGPDLENFPADVNPLTGLAVSDSSLLDLPAVLVSISNMPVTTRPQAGPAFASWVFELFIGEGATRFMNVFYGEYPRVVPNIVG